MSTPSNDEAIRWLRDSMRSGFLDGQRQSLSVLDGLSQAMPGDSAGILKAYRYWLVNAIDEYVGSTGDSMRKT